ncbi:methylated-DNA--[protein]-cysteine S-methyltransferase [Serpentinicella alkaliphila]|uniref:Methylated-DNA--protein-cysteine methyltransferase n=1 Tax=Serpentinicella alkaliphila TaxID=1734049 RepID=A0A4R2TIQ1_9FIRM|nr:methylated-DNA--[protein]-cysteine S-methyltransferase [Serpentinicella alkaliphila]TCQ02162.1 methylated-DNA-[protein]-cysteine S-methyltransferase [Serpentinicella alkaliphila]
MPNIYYSNLNISNMNLWLASCSEGVISIGLNEKKEDFIKDSNKHFREYTLKEDSLANKEVAIQLEEYFMGRRKEFSFPVILKGTDFQKKVWAELMKVPFGQIATYKDIALRIENEKATRAVGMANNKNRLPIVVPCHRIIGSNGALVGYAGGIEIKKQLLAIEGIRCLNDKIKI